MSAIDLKTCASTAGEEVAGVGEAAVGAGVVEVAGAVEVGTEVGVEAEETLGVEGEVVAEVGEVEAAEALAGVEAEVGADEDAPDNEEPRAETAARVAATTFPDEAMVELKAEPDACRLFVTVFNGLLATREVGREDAEV